MHMDAKWIKEHLDLNGRTQAELARFTGISPDKLSKIMNVRRGIKADEAAKISDFFRKQGITRDHSSDEAFFNSSEFEKAKQWAERPTLPVLGRAAAGASADLVINDTPVDWTFPPTNLFGLSEAFAVYIVGDSMNPKYSNGDLVYIHPSKPPRRGKPVLIETTGHKGFVKIYEKWDGDTIVLRQFNPDQEIRIDRKDILRILAVVGSLEG